jgi:hypothetical protein
MMSGCPLFAGMLIGTVALLGKLGGLALHRSR